MSNVYIIEALRDITSTGDAASHGKAVGVLIALGHYDLAMRAEVNFDRLCHYGERKRDADQKRWERALALSPEYDALGAPARLWDIPPSEFDALLQKEDTERRTIVTLVDKIAESLYDSETIRDEEGRVPL